VFEILHGIRAELREAKIFQQVRKLGQQSLHDRFKHIEIRYHFRSCWWDCSVCSWGLRWFTLIIRVALNSRRIQFFMTCLKHIEIHYHFICDYVQRGAVELQYISTEEQDADILTKALGRGKFVFFKDKLGVVSNTFLGKRECWNFN